jgi:peptidoglycan-N-acetylglucosamine deacetylase
VPLRQRLRDVAFKLAPRDRVLTRGPATARRIAITFDDGPQRDTLALLDLLDDLDVAATFFLMGDLSEQRPEIVREYVRRGHQVGAHGYNHHRFPSLTLRELDAQLEATEIAIGPQPHGRWVRPPYGKLGVRSFGRLLATDRVIALWSFDSADYDATDPDVLVERCAPRAIVPGDVLLFHEGMPATLAALPRIIGALHADGYECVTMADLFAT